MISPAILVAADVNNVIGYKNQLPWHLSPDLKYFKKLTMGHAIIMGRKTYDSIGKPLPGRNNIVVTRNKYFSAEGVVVVHSVEEALKAAGDDEQPFIIGGAEIFKTSMHLAKVIFLTRIYHEFKGDTWFPEMKDEDWELIEDSGKLTDEKSGLEYSFLKYG